MKNKKKLLWLTAATCLLILVVLFLWPRSVNKASYHTPTLPQLNDSIDAAEQYYQGLYKPVGDNQAVVSEYYSVPLNFYFQKQNKTVLLGQNTTITKHWENNTSEGAIISTESPEPLKMDYTVSWGKTVKLLLRQKILFKMLWYFSVVNL